MAPWQGLRCEGAAWAGLPGNPLNWAWSPRSRLATQESFPWESRPLHYTAREQRPATGWTSHHPAVGGPLWMSQVAPEFLVSLALWLIFRAHFQCLKLSMRVWEGIPLGEVANRSKSFFVVGCWWILHSEPKAERPKWGRDSDSSA